MPFQEEHHRCVVQEREGLSGDMYTYTSLIGGCAYTRQPALAYELVSRCSPSLFACVLPFSSQLHDVIKK